MTHIKLIKLLLPLTLTIFCNFGGITQILFKNLQKEPVMVAFAHYTTQSGTWTTRGWYTVNANATMTAFPVINSGDSIGYWAMTTLSETVFAGNRSLLVHNDEEFSIRNAQLASTLKQQPSFEWRKFRLIRLSPGTAKGTITLDK